MVLRYGGNRDIDDCIFSNSYAILPQLQGYFAISYNKAYLLCILVQ